MNKFTVLSWILIFSLGVCESSGNKNFTQETLLLPVASAIPESNCDCGIVSPTLTHITVDRLQIPSIELPWMATVIEHSSRRNIRRLCPATVISLSYVVTSAHCINGRIKSSLGVKLDYFNEHRSFLNVQRVKIHPKFQNGRDHAIALLKIVVPKNISPHLTHACVPSKAETLNQTSVNSFNQKLVLTKRWLYSKDPMASQAIRFPKHAQVKVSAMSTGNCSALYPALLKARTTCIRLHKDAMFMRNLRNDFFCLNEPGEALYQVNSPKDKRLKARKYILIGMTSMDSHCSKEKFALNTITGETTSAVYKLKSYSKWIRRSILDGPRCRN